MRSRHFVPAEEATGRTVQILAFHPFSKTQILWGHGLLETTGVIPPGFSGHKPEAWQNLGGGEEKDELEVLRKLYPEHPLFERSDLTSAEKAIIACGTRELRWESGYTDFDINVPSNGDDFRFYTYRYLSGHEVVTLVAQVNSLVPEEAIYEDTEIEKVDWFDFTQPLSVLFADRVARPHHPYYSHIRRTLIALTELDRRAKRDAGKTTVSLLGGQVHPSWKTVFSVGRGDPRFPEVGYLIPAPDWYILFHDMLKDGVEAYDLDFIYWRFRHNIEYFKNIGGQRAVGSVSASSAEVQADRAKVSDEGNEEPTEELTPEMLAEEEQTYRAMSLEAYDESWLKFVKEQYGI